MRRKDREITDKSQIKEFISSEQILSVPALNIMMAENYLNI